MSDMCHMSDGFEHVFDIRTSQKLAVSMLPRLYTMMLVENRVNQINKNMLEIKGVLTYHQINKNVIEMKGVPI